MCKLIIAGHGSYGTSIRRSLHMIFGETEGIFFIDFTEEDSADTLRQKLEEAVSQCGSDSILFCCDIAGGTPFNECVRLSLQEPSWETVAGLNLAACADLALSCSGITALEAAQQAETVTKESVLWAHLS